MSKPQQTSQYSEKFNVALQWLWGDGFLSPGGEEEVKEMLRGIDVAGKRVLDVGCGLGAAAVMLVRQFGAAHVTGVDVEAHLVESCRQRAAEREISTRTEFVLVEPGPLPFPAASFDVVFSKDAIVHIPDKAAFYNDVMRVLRPGGFFVGSDWLCGDESTHSPKAKEWLGYVHLDFQMSQGPEVESMVRAAGFAEVRLNDRNAWYRGEIERELASLQGDNLKKLESMIGAEEAAYRVKISGLKRHAIDDGFLRPTHIFAAKPGV